MMMMIVIITYIKIIDPFDIKKKIVERNCKAKYDNKIIPGNTSYWKMQRYVMIYFELCHNFISEQRLLKLFIKGGKHHINKYSNRKD